MSYVFISYDLIVLQISAPIPVSPVIIFYADTCLQHRIGYLHARGYAIVIISTQFRFIYNVRKCGNDDYPDIRRFACFDL